MLFLLATDTYEKLRLAQNYREFLSLYFEMRGLSLSTFARLTGHARGFPSDVLRGRRRLSLQSFRAFEKALKLPPAGKKFFKCLVAREEPDLFPENSRASLLRSLSELSSSPWQQSFREAKEVTGAEELLKRPSTLVVLAALGTPESGASTREISQRTGIANETLFRILEELLSANMIETKEERYFASDFHVFLSAQKQRAAFQALFQTACSQAGARAATALDSRDEMFFSSFLCVRSEMLSEFKSELKNLLLKFVDDSLSPDGDQVVNIVAAFFRGQAPSK